MARTGLFFALTASLAGQLREWNFFPGFLPSDPMITIRSHGFFVTYDLPGTYPPVPYPVQYRDEVIVQSNWLTIVDNHSIRWIWISHWLIITTVAVFYAALKWVYRKREVADE